MDSRNNASEGNSGNHPVAPAAGNAGPAGFGRRHITVNPSFNRRGLMVFNTGDPGLFPDDDISGVALACILPVTVNQLPLACIR